MFHQENRSIFFDLLKMDRKMRRYGFFNFGFEKILISTKYLNKEQTINFCKSLLYLLNCSLRYKEPIEWSSLAIYDKTPRA